ncbi:unnamed protein product [Cylindrotheca closterium]|uniref:EF-hand domain-containing protein n=1 Tax=Cylindrotheca closterium TaxID=2856 RepID=A0AAD2CPK9_9STRA|nr:unnamed protein product [Cylindrotheca closterium]
MMTGSKTVSAATGDVMPIGIAMEQPASLAVDATIKNRDSSDFDSSPGDQNDGVDGAELHSPDLELAEQIPQDGSESTAKTDLEPNLDLISKLIIPAVKTAKSVEWAAKDENHYPEEYPECASQSSIGSSPDSSGRITASTSADYKDEMEMAQQQADYLKRKRVFIGCAAGLLAFNSGFLNGATLSGLASPGSKFPALTVTGVTASFTFAGLTLSQGWFEAYGVHVGIILSYFVGCLIAGLATPDPKPYRLEPTYGPTFILGGIFLLIGGIIASVLEDYGVVAYWFSAAASGIQNGIASRYSSNLIRCTVTGTTTDIALILAQLIRGKEANVDHGIVLSIITFNFWFGGAISFFAAERFLKYTLLANAVLFWMIGLGIIFFLVSELGLSVNAAVSGNWKWRKTMQSLRQASEKGHVSLVDMFDIIDKNQNGEVSPEDLLDGLLQAGVKTNLRTVRVLVSYADANNNGTIDRDEWVTVVERIMEGAPTTSGRRGSVATRITDAANKIEEGAI